MIPAMYTPLEVAKRLKKHRNWVYRCIRQGSLPACKIGRSYRVRSDTLADFIEKMSKCPMSNAGQFL